MRSNHSRRSGAGVVVDNEVPPYKQPFQHADTKVLSDIERNHLLKFLIVDKHATSHSLDMFVRGPGIHGDRADYMRCKDIFRLFLHTTGAVFGHDPSSLLTMPHGIGDGHHHDSSIKMMARFLFDVFRAKP